MCEHSPARAKVHGMDHLPNHTCTSPPAQPETAPQAATGVKLSPALGRQQGQVECGQRWRSWQIIKQEQVRIHTRPGWGSR